MKTIHKVIAIMLGVLIAASLLSGCSMGTNEKKKTEDMQKTAVESFSSISLEVGVAAVDIIPEADEFAIEYHIVDQTVEYSVKDGLLTMTAKGGNVITVNDNEQSYIKIYVPQGSEFDAIDCTTDVGDVRIEKCKVDAMTINTDVGKLNISAVEVNKTLTVKTAVGDVDIALVNTECSYDISADVGDISINGIDHSGMDVTESYSAENGPQVSITTATGNINFEFHA